MFYFQNYSDLAKPTESGKTGDTKRISNTENWVDEHGDYLYGIALLRVGDKQVAEDIVQDTFMAALKALDSFEGKSTERTWLVSILKRKIIDFYRKNKRFIYFDHDGDTDELPYFHHTGQMRGTWKAKYAPDNWDKNPLDALERSEFREVLQICIRNLPENLAAIFTLREIDGWSTEDICKELEITASNLWVMLHRSRTRLRRCLEERWFSGHV